MNPPEASILIVDDSPPVRSVLRYLLTQAGFVIYEAADGRAALEAYRRRPVDMLMIDAHMPDWDGVATLHAFRKEFPDASARIIVMTGDPTSLPAEFDPERGIRSPVHRILAKPFHPIELLRQIHEEFRAGRPPSRAGSLLDERDTR